MTLPRRRALKGVVSAAPVTTSTAQQPEVAEPPPSSPSPSESVEADATTEAVDILQHPHLSEPDPFAPEPDKLHANHEVMAVLYTSRLKQLEQLPRLTVLPFGFLGEPLEPPTIPRLSEELFVEHLSERGGFILNHSGEIRRQALRLMSEDGNYTTEQIAALAHYGRSDLVLVGQLGALHGNDELYRAHLRLFELREGKPELLMVSDHDLSRAALEAGAPLVIQEQRREDALWRSLALPGWGQFYNRQYGKGAIFMASAGAIVAGAIGSLAAGLVAKSDYESDAMDQIHRRGDANAHFDRANLLFIALGSVWGAAAADAWFSGKDGYRLRLESLSQLP